jgi:hypothetical protein
MSRLAIPIKFGKSDGIIGGFSVCIPYAKGVFRIEVKVTNYSNVALIDFDFNKIIFFKPYFSISIISRNSVKKYGIDIYGKFFTYKKKYTND